MTGRRAYILVGMNSLVLRESSEHTYKNLSIPPPERAERFNGITSNSPIQLGTVGTCGATTLMSFSMGTAFQSVPDHA